MNVTVTEIVALASVAISLLSLVLSRRKTEAEAESLMGAAIKEIAEASVGLVGPASDRVAKLEQRVTELETLRARDQRTIAALRSQLRRARQRIRELEERLAASENEG